MLRPRIIPSLLLRNGGLVKTVRFTDDEKYVGDPVNAVRIFNEKEADELIVVDIDATTRGAEPNVKLIAQIAVECRMPLCYGGGITTVEQASRIIGLGVEKIAISSAALHNPGLVPAIAHELGSQSVVVVYDVRRRADGSDYDICTHNGRKPTGQVLSSVVRQAASLGAGEILINDIDRDGTMRGYDVALAQMVRSATTLPMTVLGGANSLADIEGLFAACGVVGAAAGSLFVFKGSRKAVLINYPAQAQKDDIVRAAQARPKPV